MASASYLIEVNYSISIKDMVEAGKFDQSNFYMLYDSFSARQSGLAHLDIELVHFNWKISGEDVIKDFESKGLCPAEPHEILAFGAKHPEVQCEFPVVALDSSWENGRVLTCLEVGIAGRTANFYVAKRFIGSWSIYCRFAAIRK